MVEDQERRGWWQTIPGILTATAGIITALAGLIAALHQPGNLSFDNKEQLPRQNIPAATADLIAGKWAGEAQDVNGGSFRVNVDIKKSCTLNEKCGSISVSHVPCHGDLFLEKIENDSYEFRVDNFASNSSSTCTPAAVAQPCPFRFIPNRTRATVRLEALVRHCLPCASPIRAYAQ